MRFLSPRELKIQIYPHNYAAIFHPRTIIFHTFGDMLSQIKSQLHALASEEKAAVLRRFFKTGPGEYGEGDLFVGITVPLVRSVAKSNIGAPLDVLGSLLQRPVHEERLCALLILVEQYRLFADRRQAIVDFYLHHTAGINNWDLVDLSAPKIIGRHALLTDDHTTLHRLSRSTLMWEQRIAMVSCLALIKADRLQTPLQLAEYLLHHPHPLMHKATGWMLREIGKRDITPLTEFLDLHATTMPRTSLRYAIERLSPSLRQHYMQAKNILSLRSK